MLFYYYPWSTHLQLSYYDGPPLIAYVIRLITLMIGQNAFALNFFGVVIIGITYYVIFKIGELLKNAQLGILAASMWLVYPFSTTRFIFITLNYDCLDNLLSLASVLFILRYIKYKKIEDIYYSGLMLGGLLLAKYTGIILILGIFIYLVFNLPQLLRN
ncbi:MAG: glycosyltransferase family 39 protein, partial [Burkholderiales bacterium]|nr:glycosyltransferase family 39 protein [Burkholderiales bacterium]